LDGYRPSKPGVAGSNPAGRANVFRGIRSFWPVANPPESPQIQQEGCKSCNWPCPLLADSRDLWTAAPTTPAWGYRRAPRRGATINLVRRAVGPGTAPVPGGSRQSTSGSSARFERRPRTRSRTSRNCSRNSLASVAASVGLARVELARGRPPDAPETRERSGLDAPPAPRASCARSRRA
jgi:hypothetical protein